MSPKAKHLQGLPPLDLNPAEAWPMMHRRLTSMVKPDASPEEFAAKLTYIEQGIDAMLPARADDSLFVLVQMLSHQQLGYSASHALLAAVICQMIAPLVDLPPDQTQSLTRAALTMNMAMAPLHDRLAEQTFMADDDQRLIIRGHPAESARMLKEMGVNDELWLALVAEHHEVPDGSGYPEGKTQLSEAQQLLHMTDVFIARISPRKSRRGLSPNVAAGNIYLEAQERSSRLGAVFVKQLGMYPPGTYVRLKTEETAVVVRRGDRVNAPLAVAIADELGLPLNTPGRRDTQVPTYAVKHAVPPEEIKITLNVSRLLKRI